MRTFLLISIASSLTILSGCDDQSADSNCRYYIQQDLDNQNFDSAITRLQSETCLDTYSDNEYLIDLASAYLGTSGYSLPNILSAALVDDDEVDAFESFTSEMSELKNDNSLEYLGKTQDSYTEYLGGYCIDIIDKTATQEGICLIKGVVDITKTALAIDYLTSTDAESDSDALDLSTCALEYTLNYTDSITLPYDCGDAQVDSSEELVFTIPNDDESEETVTKTYQHLTVSNTDDSSTKNFLQSIPETGTSSIVFTNGYCTTDYIDCGEGDDLVDEIDGAACYICPSQSEDDETVNDLLVESLNNGLDNIDSLLDDIAEDNNDLQESIDEFKDEIGTCSESTAADACVDEDADYTLEDIIDYLNSQESE